MIWKFFFLLIIVVSIVDFVRPGLHLKYRLGFNAYRIWYQREWYRLFSSMLVHGDFLHLLFNLFTFYFFSKALDLYLREIHYLLIFLGGHLVSHLLDLVNQKQAPHYYSIGASGGVSALVFSYVAIDPTAMFLVFFIPMPAFLFAILFLAYTIYGTRQSTAINHYAHLLGSLYGFFITFVLHPVLIEKWKIWLLR